MRFSPSWLLKWSIEGPSRQTVSLLATALSVLMLGGSAYGAQGASGAAECRPFQVVEGEYLGPSAFDHGLLWKVTWDGAIPSFLFGTIHVADEEVVNLPEPVSEALNDSSVFVMEVLPDAAQILVMAELMFFNDGRQLSELLSAPLYERTVEILGAYHLAEEAVATMKPWAAFLTISYPPDMRDVLDLQLLQRAQERGAQIHSLESLEEQGSVFNDMDLNDQVRLLADAVCHYETANEDFERMKALYLDRDLKGLYRYGQRYAFADNALYERLTKRLLTDRNQAMATRMQPHLQQGGAFVAIGAMHLPGEAGVLDLLARNGYEISRVY